jgi:hypothetical protein
VEQVADQDGSEADDMGNDTMRALWYERPGAALLEPSAGLHTGAMLRHRQLERL